MSSLTLRPCVCLEPSLASVQKEDIVDRLTAMELQCKSAYECQDYISSETNENDRFSVDEECRTQVCEWLYRVADHLQVDRDVVMIAIILLDCFMTYRPRTRRRNFRLAAMASFHLASKLYGGKTVKMSFLVELSRGEFLIQHVAEMEELLLVTLKWRVNPTTPLTFMQHFLALLPSNTPNALREEIYQYSRFFLELSSCDYTFATQKCCHVAIASMTNVFDAIASSVNFESNDKTEFLQTIFTAAKLTKQDRHKIDALKDRLWTLFMECEEYHSGPSSHLSVFALQRPYTVTHNYACREDGGSSPVCVSSKHV